MTERFDLGEPGLGDPTSEWEEDMTKAMNIFNRQVTDDGPKIANRNFFTNKVSTNDRQQDWLAGKEDPNWWLPQIQAQLPEKQQGQGYTQAELLLAYKSVEKMDLEIQSGLR